MSPAPPLHDDGKTTDSSSEVCPYDEYDEPQYIPSAKGRSPPHHRNRHRRQVRANTNRMRIDCMDDWNPDMTCTQRAVSNKKKRGQQQQQKNKHDVYIEDGSLGQSINNRSAVSPFYTNNEILVRNHALNRRYRKKRDSNNNSNNNHDPSTTLSSPHPSSTLDMEDSNRKYQYRHRPRLSPITHLRVLFTLRRSLRVISLVITLLLFSALLLIFSVIHGFIRDTTSLCSPPSSIPYGVYQNRPLVEYYVHGRGRGHYSRSVAIIDRLKKEGVDVRMFLGRATMWKEMNSVPHDSGGRESILYSHGLLSSNRTLHPTTNQTTLSPDTSSPPDDKSSIGTTTAISVTSIVPHLSLPSAVSHIVERITGDCEVALQSSRYPLLVISDGDLPGMLRAKLGGIPCVSISHGMTFAISHPPDYLDIEGVNAWTSQARLNTRASFFSDWQIGTNMVNLEAKKDSSVIAKPIMRKKIIDMERERSGRMMRDNVKRIPGRRNIVVCYFRDKNNGDGVISALLDEGFDVILFNPSRTWKMEEGEEIAQKRWIPPHSSSSESTTTTDQQQQGGGLNFNVSSLDDLDMTRQRIVKKQLKKTNQLSSLLHHTMYYNNNNNNNNNTTRNDDDDGKPKIVPIRNRNLFVPFMAMADGIASSAGSQLLSECLFARIPVLALHEESDVEQMLNVEMARNMFKNSEDEGKDDDDNHNNNNNVVGDDDTTTTNTMVFGSSFESMDGMEIKHHKEFRAFVHEAKQSRVSQAYYREMEDLLDGSNNNDGSSGEKIKNKDDVAAAAAEGKMKKKEKRDDFWSGMPDADAVIVEIVRLLRDSKYVTKFVPNGIRGGLRGVK